MATMLEPVQAMLRGEAPAPPVARLSGFDGAEVGPGRAVFALQAGPRHANPMGTLHGGLPCDLADAAKRRPPRARRGGTGAGSSATSALPHRWMASATRPKARPLAVREYCTRTGGPATTLREMMPFDSNALRRADRVFAPRPRAAVSSSP